MTPPYEKREIEITQFEVEDVITSSGIEPGGDIVDY